MKEAVAEYIAGAVAGAANVTSGYPFDTIKVRLQTSPKVYRNSYHCAVSVVKHEGVSALFRGILSPLIGGTLETGVNYMVYSRVLDYLEMQRLQHDDNLKMKHHPRLVDVGISAAISGFALSFILSPIELIKCRMQASAQHYTSAYHCLQQTIKYEGVKGLTRGLGGTLAREVPGNALYFVSYQFFRQNFPQASKAADSDSSGVAGGLYEGGTAVISGGLAGCVMWGTVLPIDAAKTRIQTAFPGSLHDVGIVDQLKFLYRQGGGVKGLFPGLAPTLIRAFPANACQWLAWEISMKYIK